MILDDGAHVKTWIEMKRYIVPVGVALQEIELKSIGTGRNEASDEDARACRDATGLNGRYTTTTALKTTASERTSRERKMRCWCTNCEWGYE